MKRLPSMDEVGKEMASRDVATGGDVPQWLVDRLEACRERDRIAEGRPDGCFCLGTGDKSDVQGAGRYSEDGQGGYELANGLLWCPCPEGEEARQESMAEFRREMQEERERMCTAIGIPRRFWGACSHRNEVPPALQPATRQIDEHVEALGQQLLDGADSVWPSSWFFHGPYGRGKTSLAVAYLWALVNAECVANGLFVTTPNLFSRLRSTYGRSEGESEWEALEEYSNAGALLLDDLGAEAIGNQEWLQDRLYQVIGDRHGDMKPTIFTSNLSIKELPARIGERLTWRIVEMCGDNIVHLDGPNLRDSK